MLDCDEQQLCGMGIYIEWVIRYLNGRQRVHNKAAYDADENGGIGQSREFRVCVESGPRDGFRGVRRN